MKWVHITSITICEPINLPVKISEWKPSVMKILSTSTSPSEVYGQINLTVEITTPSNLGPSTISDGHAAVASVCLYVAMASHTSFYLHLC